MQDTTLFETILGITTPWHVARVELKTESGKSFDAVMSKERAVGTAVSTFAHRIMLNVNGLRGNLPETWSLPREHPGALKRMRKTRMKWARKRAT